MRSSIVACTLALTVLAWGCGGGAPPPSAPGGSDDEEESAPSAPAPAADEPDGSSGSAETSETGDSRSGDSGSGDSGSDDAEAPPAGETREGLESARAEVRLQDAMTEAREKTSTFYEDRTEENWDAAMAAWDEARELVDELSDRADEIQGYHEMTSQIGRRQMDLRRDRP